MAFKRIFPEDAKWTWVLFNQRTWRVLRQVPDPTTHWDRVISTEVARDVHVIEWEDFPRPGKPGCNYETEVAAIQRRIGEQYATEEYPLRTSLDSKWLDDLYKQSKVEE